MWLSACDRTARPAAEGNQSTPVAGYAQDFRRIKRAIAEATIATESNSAQRRTTASQIVPPSGSRHPTRSHNCSTADAHAVRPFPPSGSSCSLPHESAHHRVPAHDRRPAAHGRRWNGLVDEVLKLADTDGDGRPTWKELCASKRFKYGQFGNLPIEDDNGEKQIIERYDIDRDGVVDRDASCRGFSRATPAARGRFRFAARSIIASTNRRGAPTWRVIDADEDGAISRRRDGRGPSRLASRDTDDDEILLVGDLNPRLQAPDPGDDDRASPPRTRRGPAAWPACRLGHRSAALEQNMAAAASSRPIAFPLTPDFSTQLDKNDDGRMQADEFAG